MNGHQPKWQAWLLWLFQILGAGAGAVGKVMSTFGGPPW